MAQSIMDGILNNKSIEEKLIKDRMIQDCILLLEKVREAKPMIHVIPNMVSAAFVADAISCIGARPIMAIAEEEMDEITSHADALVLNMGQPTSDKLRAANKALATARKFGVPVVLDPVGAGACGYRKEVIKSILDIPWNGIIKGNYYELETIQKGVLQYQGVDSKSGNDLMPPQEEGRTFAITGEEDIVMNTKLKCIMPHRYKEMPYKVVGTGCVAAGLCGVFSASNIAKDNAVAAITGLTVLSFAQDEALKQQKETIGYGGYKSAILDQLSNIQSAELQVYLEEVLRIECI